jgi:hypothetical protein
MAATFTGAVTLEGAAQVFIVVEKKRQGLATRAFLDRAAAKLKGSNRTTEITTYMS